MNLQEIFQAGLTSSIVISYLYMKMMSAQSIGFAGWESIEQYLETASCTQWTTFDGLSAANCSQTAILGTKQTLYKIPTTLPNSLQVFDFRPSESGEKIYSAIVIQQDTFKPYPQLRRILLEKSFQFIITASSQIEHVRKIFQTTFTGLTSLEYLEMSASNLEEWFVVHLPPQLKSLNLDHNRYFTLDVHWAEELNELSIKFNFLNNIPRVSVPSPPLKKLWMTGNPMKNMTVVDIAQLCELTFFEFLPNPHYTSVTGYCQCVMLKKWAEETELKGLEDLKCYEKGDESTCSKNILEEARKVRKQCPLLFANSPTLTVLKQGLKYTFMFILLALLAASLTLYIIRHFHLREYWRAHHLMMSQATSINMEEGEERIIKSSDESQDSSIEG